jgi:uncharacterized protein (TIGR03790 family)
LRVIGAGVWLLALALLFQPLTSSVFAGEADSVVVIYNRRSKDSQSVAEHYAAKRGVPRDQLLALPLPMTEAMTRLEYRKQLEEPLLAWLKEKELFTWPAEPAANGAASNGQPGLTVPTGAKVRYAVLCFDVPLKIQSDPSLREDGVDPIPPPLRRNEAAVDSELAFLPTRGLRLTGPAPSRVYATTNASDIHPTNGVWIVARLDGPTPDIARGLVDKALAAETNGLWGRAYFDLRGLKDGDYKLGDDILRGAALVARRQGFETVVDEGEATLPGDYPLSHAGIYAGWYAGDANGPFAQEKVEFLPGAFAYHLHSFSANTLRSGTRHWCGPFLAKGATVTLGSVFEPYLGGTPDVAALLSRWVELGFSYGEAAIAAQQSLSWQTTVVGDPLYRPFARKPKELHEDLERRKEPWLEWSHLRVVNLNLATGLREPQLTPYLEEIALTKTSAVLMEKLGDLYAAGGKPASAKRAYEQALALNPSPQQRARLNRLLAPATTAP